MIPANNRPPRKSFDKVRGITGMAMGVFYFAIAYWVVYMEQIGQFNIGKTFSYLAAGLMVMYGAFRIFRGYRIYKGSAQQ